MWKSTIFFIFFLLAGWGWWCLCRIATKPMVYLGFKTAKKACHLKGVWFFSSISASMEKHREEATWLRWKGFTNLVDNECNIWQSYTSSGSLGISLCWNITVHQITRDGSYFTNKLLYSRTYIKKKKQKKKNLCAYERKATCIGASCLYLFTRRDIVTNHV